METGPPPGSSSASPHTGGHWTRNRLELLAWLRRNALSLAELYVGAVQLLYENAVPGRSRFIAHAVREIRNRLPEVVSGARSGSVFQWKQRLDELTKAWTKVGLALDGSLPLEVVPAGRTIHPRPSEIKIPQRLFLKIANVLREHDLARTRPVDAATNLFEGCSPENRRLASTLSPIIRQWLEVTEWFVGKAHDSGGTDETNDMKEFESRFLLFETTLSALLRSFFSGVDRLDEILEDANS